MIVMVVPLVIGVLGTGLIKGLVILEIQRRVETIQITALLRLRLKETCCHFDSNRKPSANVGVKKSQRN